MSDRATYTADPSVDQRWTIETGLYLLVGATALFLRLHHLGDPLLSNAEAREALAVWRFAMSRGGALEPVSPAWFALTYAAFALLGASEFAARLWPSLAGAAVAFAPAIFRREVGRGAALVACALLAISPVAIASSRAADGTTLAAFALMLIVIGLRQSGESASRRGMIVAGIGLGLGLADGPRFISAAAASLFALALIGFGWPSFFRRAREGWSAHAGSLLLSAAAAFVLFASAALVNRPGLTAAGSGLTQWLGGWIPTPQTREVPLVVKELVVYEPLTLIFALAGSYVAYLSGLWHAVASRMQLAFSAAVAGADDPPAAGAAALPWRETAQRLSAAAVGAILFGVVYPGREASDALWAIVPMAVLAGKVLAEVFARGGEQMESEWGTIAAQAGVLFIMLVFAYFNVAAYARSTFRAPNMPETLPLTLALGVLALGAIVTILFASGWSKLAALRGASLALGAAALIGTLGAGLALTQWRADDPRELWPASPTAANVRLLMKTVRDISNRAVGSDHDIEVTVLNDDPWNDRDGVLGWTLREFRNAHFVDGLSADVKSPIVITSDSVSDPTLGSAYMGEPFAVYGRRTETPLTLRSALDWWLFRNGEVEYSRRVVWVRQDIQLLK